MQDANREQGPEEASAPFFFPVSNADAGSSACPRLDALLPQDSETGATAPAALRSYLNAMMEMAGRYAQPLAVLAIAVDTAAEANSVLRRFGVEGARLIGQAIVRCLHQETRLHDVVGRAEEIGAYELPTFVVVCPLRDEAGAALLAERLCMAMTAYAAEPDCPWLTVSIGVAALAIDILVPEALLARAADALRYARRDKGGRVWRYTDTLRPTQSNNEPE
jgi:GGDEF domain-containing protein